MRRQHSLGQEINDNGRFISFFILNLWLATFVSQVGYLTLLYLYRTQYFNDNFLGGIVLCYMSVLKWCRMTVTWTCKIVIGPGSQKKVMDSSAWVYCSVLILNPSLYLPFFLFKSCEHAIFAIRVHGVATSDPTIFL